MYCHCFFITSTFGNRLWEFDSLSSQALMYRVYIIQGKVINLHLLSLSHIVLLLVHNCTFTYKLSNPHSLDEEKGQIRFDQNHYHCAHLPDRSKVLDWIFEILFQYVFSQSSNMYHLWRWWIQRVLILKLRQVFKHR